MKYKWGIIGAGRVVYRFLTDLIKNHEAIPYAIYARKREQGEKVARQFGIKLVFDSFEEFLNCQEIDICYVAITHPYHMEFTERCLKAKKPVLCEKPMAPNAIQEQQMISCARAENVFLMEAMWTRTFPITRQIVSFLQQGGIGKIIGVNGVFAINAPADCNDRLWNPSEGGGALLDIGIYLISYMHMIFGRKPDEIVSLANIDPIGVDCESGIVLRFGNSLATLFMTFHSEGKDTVTIYGTDGICEIYEDFWRPRKAKITYSGGIIDYISPQPSGNSVYQNDFSFSGEGYQNEVAHVHECLSKNLKESPLMPLDQSLDIIGTCDTLRKIWGVKYTFE